MEKRIVIDQKIRHGRPIINGTRVSIDIILGALAAGENYGVICKEYGITKEDILAAINYAYSIVATEEIHELKVPIKT